MYFGQNLLPDWPDVNPTEIEYKFPVENAVYLADYKTKINKIVL